MILLLLSLLLLVLFQSFNLFLLFGGIAAAIYFYYYYQSKYWERRGIPSPRGTRLFYGDAPDVFDPLNPFIRQMHEWTKELGPIYGFKLGTHNCLVVSEPNMVREVMVDQFDNFYERTKDPISGDSDKEKRITLFRSKGARWKRLRAISSPSFSTNSLRKICPVLEECATRMVELLVERHGDGSCFNIHEFFMEYTMDSISRLVMNEKQSTQFATYRVEAVRKVFDRDQRRFIVYAAFAIPGVGRLLRELHKRVQDPALRLVQEMEQAVAERVKQRSSGEYNVDAPEDYIDLFLDATADFDTLAHSTGAWSHTNEFAKKLTVDEVVMQCVVFMVAGFETTSGALAYAAWVLVEYPEVQQKVYDEITKYCSHPSADFADLSQLKYTEAMLKETLRHYPLGGLAASRTCANNTTLSGVPVEKDTLVFCDAYAVHFDKTLWGEDADEFKPERWLDPSRRPPPTAYLSFGGGPRVCIGMRLALMEEKLALVHLLRRFRLIKDPSVERLVITGSTSINPREVQVYLQPRT